MAWAKGEAPLAQGMACELACWFLIRGQSAPGDTFARNIGRNALR